VSDNILVRIERDINTPTDNRGTSSKEFLIKNFINSRVKAITFWVGQAESGRQGEGGGVRKMWGRGSNSVAGVSPHHVAQQQQQQRQQHSW
jgi:hypothetical protein